VFRLLSVPPSNVGFRACVGLGARVGYVRTATGGINDMNNLMSGVTTPYDLVIHSADERQCVIGLTLSLATLPLAGNL